jgi:tetratricopeptide (TPR) repeat protein
VPVDGPGFLHELVEALKIKYPINPKKVYLFGHSGGATFALLMSLYESEYFSATAIHAGALQADAFSLIDVAKRKTPIHIQVGTADDSYPLKVVTTTREQLNARGFAARLVVMPGHTHWYYDLAPEINERAWEFMKGFELPSEPRYEDYKFRPEGRKSTEASEQYLLGMKRQQAGDAAGAIDAYTRAIQLDAKYAEAYNNRGVAYMAQNEYVLAAVDFTRSIELAPSEAAYNNRGSIYAAQEKTGAAIADYTSAIKIKPSAEAYSNRGISYAQINRNDAALSDFDDAIKLNPKFGRAYILRGLILLKRGGQDSAAQKDFDKGFELDSSLHAEFDAIIKTRLRN